jgi:MFS family permease
MSPEFAVLMVSSVLFFGGTGILNALVPTFVVDELGGTEATAGTVMGSIAITSLVSRPFLGRVADRHGSRRILLMGTMLSVASMAIMRFGPQTIATVVASRLVLGVGMAAMFTGSTLLAVTLAPPMRQGQAASLMLVAVHAGLGVGPILGLEILDRGGYDRVWIVVGIASLLSAVVVTQLGAHPGDRDGEPPPLIHRAALAPGIVTFFGVFAFNGFLTFASLYGREIGVQDVALLFTAASGTIVVVRLAAGHIPDRIGPIRAGTGALLMTFAATLVLAFWQTPTGAFAGAIVLACGLSLQSPSFIPLAVADVPDRERGSAMATFTAFYDIAGAVIGPVIGLIVAGVSYRAAFLFTGAMALVSLALLRLLIAPNWNGSTRVVAPVAVTP